MPHAIELCWVQKSILALRDFNLLAYVIKCTENSRVFSQIPKIGGPKCLLASQNAVLPWIRHSELELIFPFPEEESLVQRSLKTHTLPEYLPCPVIGSSRGNTLLLERTNCGNIVADTVLRFVHLQCYEFYLLLSEATNINYFWFRYMKAA